MNCPASPEVNAAVRLVRRLFIRNGWSVHTMRAKGTVSRYVLARCGRKEMKVRVSDHPPAVRHSRRPIISIHPGGQTIADLAKAIEAIGTKKPRAES